MQRLVHGDVLPMATAAPLALLHSVPFVSAGEPSQHPCPS